MLTPRLTCVALALCVMTVACGGDDEDAGDTSAELLPAWFEAPKSLCTGSRMSTGDYVTP